jgi:hypothetical protein
MLILLNVFQQSIVLCKFANELKTKKATIKSDSDNEKEVFTDCNLSTLSADLFNLVRQWQECE